VVARRVKGAGGVALDRLPGISAGSSQMTVGPNEVFRQKIVSGTKFVILPPSYAAVRVHVFASGGKGVSTPRFTTERVDGSISRVLTFEAGGRKVVAASSLLDVSRSLSHLRLLLVFVSLGGIGVAALLGAIVSGRAVAPLRRLTETTERIVDTGDLSERIGQHGRDEISRLSGRLDALLATLEQSMQTQRQLVADASHELRTPIATLRANFELLARPGTLGERERGELLADVNDELESMTTLVAELVELARGEELDVPPSRFRLDEVVGAAVERAARRAPELSFRTELEPTTLEGIPERVEQAVVNLLDNARKWSPSGGTVDVVVRGGVVEVRDEGPGIASDDVPLVFNRFYRSPAARAMPGAGLGLAIVKQIADAHGGSVSIGRASQGGAIVRLELPVESPAADRGEQP
jgi:two-component system sensor histidine kinase MprB